MKKLITLTFAGFLLAGCASQPVVVTNSVPTDIARPALPAKVNMLDVQWQVITKDDLQKMLDASKLPNSQPIVLFAVTPQGYQNLALNAAELKRYILQEQDVIKYYIDLTNQQQASQQQKDSKPVVPDAQPGFFSKLFN